jgi:DMSO/TMAO reductase YedYZ molybdopterin-dependent catalytic subunit
MKKERSIVELYGDDPERAEAELFGRRTGVSRRGFLGGAGLAGMTAAVGGVAIPFAASMPGGLIPAAMAQTADAPEPFDFPGKSPGLVSLGDRPLVAETPEHMLDDETTPYENFFIRNNGTPPEPPADPDAWVVTIDGFVDTPLELTLGELKSRFEHHTRHTVLECGGNGRAFFNPPGRGNQWTNGGASCGEWTGAKLSDVLRAAGIRPEAIYTAHFGADIHLSGDLDREVISRGVRLEKAMADECMVVWGMNGGPLPDIHGGPVRLLIPGWPGSASHKWLRKITLRDVEHDGPGMTGTSYRMPIRPMIPGSDPDPDNFAIMESMPLRSIITNPANGTVLPAGTRSLALRGAAWNGDVGVKAVHLSTDFGQTWQAATLADPRNAYDWRRWTAEVSLPLDGYYEVWVRATDDNDLMQPHVAANWNPQGYGGNPMHRIAVLVA